MARRSSRRTELARAWRYAWAAPCSAVGLLLALPLLVCGGAAALRGGIVEVAAPAAWHRRMTTGAITFGHVVLGHSEEVLHLVRAHERVHVAQYERWGVLFFLAYPVSSLLQLLRGRHPYWSNVFEVQARACSAPSRNARRRSP